MLPKVLNLPVVGNNVPTLNTIDIQFRFPIDNQPNIGAYNGLTLFALSYVEFRTYKDVFNNF